MSKKRWYDYSPEFREGVHLSSAAMVTIEQDKDGHPRWRIVTPKGEIILTEHQTYNLADALDQSLKWFEDDQDG